MQCLESLLHHLKLPKNVFSPRSPFLKYFSHETENIIKRIGLVDFPFLNFKLKLKCII